MKNIGFLLILCFQYSYSQVTFHVSKLSENTSELENIYITGDFEKWSGGQENYMLKKIGADYFITFPKQEGTMKFKFTKGSWETAETNFEGKSIENRTYTFGNKIDTVHLEILNWYKPEIKKSTATKNVFVLSQNFEMPQFEGRNRKIWMYLPPNYDNSSEKYPVLYMHDGQNIFDAQTSFAGEWEVDETLNRLYEEKKFKLIVIGIDNGGDKRTDEYSPWVNPTYGGGEGDAFLDFIVETLKPFVDKNYRTLTDNINTGIMGSSLGGSISHYAGLKYPDVFGKIGVFSPAFWFAETCYDFAKEHSKNEAVKMYFLAGDQESEKIPVIADMQKMMAIMLNSGFHPNNIQSKIVPQGKHNEALWRNEFKTAVLYLFNH